MAQCVGYLAAEQRLAVLCLLQREPLGQLNSSRRQPEEGNGRPSPERAQCLENPGMDFCKSDLRASRRIWGRIESVLFFFTVKPISACSIQSASLTMQSWVQWGLLLRKPDTGLQSESCIEVFRESCLGDFWRTSFLGNRLNVDCSRLWFCFPTTSVGFDPAVFVGGTVPTSSLQIVAWVWSPTHPYTTQQKLLLIVNVTALD